jgi:hypothetical protein
MEASVSEQPDLSPAYRPATEDTMLVIRFVGNTARIQGMAVRGDIDPFQMAAAAWFLKRESEKAIAILEQRLAMSRVAVTGQMPPEPPTGGIETSRR